MATPHFLNWIEGQAYGLRELCGVSAFGRLEPLDLAQKMSVEVIVPSSIQCLSSIAQDQLKKDSSAWSAGTLHLADGRTIVVMNPMHEKPRQRASLMEELVHIKLNHKPSQLLQANGLTFRTWNQTQETEAYWIGAAALLPRRVMKGARTLGHTAEQVAQDHGVSMQLVEFREKVTGVHLVREGLALIE